MFKSTHIIGTLTLSMLAACLTGCGTGARYTESGGPESMVNVDKVNVQDLDSAISTMVEDLVGDPLMNSVENKPATFLVERITNDTSDDRVNTGQVSQTLSRQLRAFGFEANSVYNVNGKPQSQIAQDIIRKRANREGKSPDELVKDPDFIVVGKIFEKTTFKGRTRQSNYWFELNLISTQTGNNVWTKSTAIQKIGTRPAIGF